MKLFSFFFTAIFFSFLSLIFAFHAHALGINSIKGTVNASGGIYLRSCASTSCTGLKLIPYNTLLTFTESSGDWWKTTYSGSTGWVNSWSTTLQGTSSTVINRGNTSRKMMALTFDAGGDLGYTNTILTVLRNHGVKASFGLTGKWVDAYPTVASLIASEGHHLINHTYNHPSFTGLSTGTGALSPAKRIAEIQQTEDAFQRATGRTAKPYFRQPYLDYDTGSLRDIGAYGFDKSILGVDSDGWRGISADQICNNVVNRAGNGVIVIMHVYSQSQDGNALNCIITRLKAQGYTFGTVPDVLSATTPTSTPSPTPTTSLPSTTPTPTGTQTTFVVSAYDNPPTGLTSLSGYDSRRTIIKVNSPIKLTRVACYGCGVGTKFVLYSSSSSYNFGTQLFDVNASGTSGAWAYANVSPIPLTAGNYYALRFDPAASPSYVGTTQQNYNDVSFLQYSTYNAPTWKPGSFEIQLTYIK